MRVPSTGFAAQLLAAVTALLLTTAGAAAQTTQHRIAIDSDGRIPVSRLVDVALTHLGSRVVAPPGLGGRVEVTGIGGRLALASVTAALGGAGITAEIEGNHVVVTIDRTAWLAGLDSAERVLRRWMGAPAEYRLRRVKARDGPVVVLVHGLDSSADNLADAADALSERGYDVWLFSYPDDGRIEHTAARLGEQLRTLREATGQVVHLVTTSMGGVIARLYVETSPAYAGEVATFIACNPPFEGSWMANYHELWELAESVVDLVGQGLDGSPVHDGLGQAATELLPGSALMERLRTSERRAGVRYAILAGAAPVADPRLLEAASVLVAAARPPDQNPWVHLALDLTAELIETARLHGERGDGAVELSRQALPGVTDRVVRSDVHHLAALSRREDGTIVWLDEVLARLPRPR